MTQHPTEATLTEVARARARAEFAEYEAILIYQRRAAAEIEDSDLPAITRLMHLNLVTVEIAQAMKLAETTVQRMVSQASRVRSQAPRVWSAFSTGLIDAVRVRLIAAALDKLTSDRARELLDDTVVDYAAAHTPTEVRAWLKRFVARAEPENFTERAEAARARRTVEISHDDDGMSWLSAYLPPPVAVAVSGRLQAATRLMRAEELENSPAPRTLDQIKADVLAHWLTNSEGTETVIAASIHVTVDAGALAGFTQQPAIVDDEPVPVGWVRELALSGNPFWTTVLTDRGGRILDVQYRGYQAPEHLRRALQIRDGTCRVSGCRRPARDCDLDHVIPFDSGGSTTAANLRSLCRRHHGLKGHGLLDERRYDGVP